MKPGDKLYVYQAQFTNEIEISQEIFTVTGFNEYGAIQYEVYGSTGIYNPNFVNTITVNKENASLASTEDKLSEMKNEFFEKIREQLKKNLEVAQRTIESANKILLQLENPEEIEVGRRRI